MWSGAESSAGMADCAVTDLPILALISSPNLPDPLPTYSNDSSILASLLIHTHPGSRC